MIKEGSDYQRSIALLCRDFLTQMDDFPEFARENDLLDRITSVIIEEGDEDLFHIKNLESHMFKYSNRLLTIYSRYPQNTHIDALYRRAESLKEMCENLLRTSSADNTEG